MRNVLEEKVIQTFPHRCPYCDQFISYDQFDLKIGENRIKCPSCKKEYIRMVLDSSEEPQKSTISSGEYKKARMKTKRHPHLSPSKGRGYTK